MEITFLPVEADQHLTIGPMNKIPLYYETYGDQETAKYTILMIHGAFQALQCWRTQFSFFSSYEGFVVAMDLPWHGQSNPIDPDLQPSPQIWAESIQTIIDEQHLYQKPLFLLCWSMGGLVVRHFIHHYGLDGISGLISVASVLIGTQTFYEYPTPTEAAGASLASMMTPNTALSFDQRVHDLDLLVDFLTLKQPDLSEYYYTYGYNARSWTTTSHLGPSLFNDISVDTYDFLRRITIPTLVIQGCNDALVPSAIGKLTARFIPQATLKDYEDCGHSPFLEYSHKFNTDVLTFITDVCNNGSSDG